MTELSNQIQARRERLQRFAEAATRFQDRGRAVADIKQTAILEHCLAQPKSLRREYETAHSQPVYTPIISRIMRAVSEEFDMPVSEIVSPNQTSKYCLPRYVAIGLMLALTNMSWPAIGRRLGGRNHATVLAGNERFLALMESEAFRNRFEQIKAGIAQ